MSNSNRQLSPVITSRAWGQLVAFWVAAVALGAVLAIIVDESQAWTIAWDSRAAPASPGSLRALAGDTLFRILILSLFSFFLAHLLFALRATWSWLRFGELTLQMDPHPGSVGADVGGFIELPIALHRGRTVPIELRCVEVRTRTTGRVRKRPKTLWSDTRRFFGEPTGDGASRVFFRFPMPFDVPITGGPFRWEVEMSCKVDLVRIFEIPVSGGLRHMAAAVRVREQQKPDA